MTAFHQISASAPPPGEGGTRYLTANGKTVHANISGQGRHVILLHGASGSLRDMTFDLAGRLAERYRVIAFDRPGLGHSEPLFERGESPREQARHLARAAHGLGVQRAIVVGHSYGGAVALAWGLEHPEMTDAVVSLAGAAMPWPGGLGAWYSIASSTLGGALVVPVIAALLPDSFVERAARGVFDPNEMPEGYAAHLEADVALDADRLVHNARQVNTLKPHLREMSQHYRDLPMPVEIVHGLADDTVPAKIHSIPLAELSPQANLKLLPGIGHMPHHIAIDETVAAIDRAAARSASRNRDRAALDIDP